MVHETKWSQWCTDLDQRAAAPLSCLQFAAGRSWSAAALVVTFDVVGGVRLGHGAQFGEPGNNVRAPRAGGAVRLAAVTAGAAVVSVITAHSLQNRRGNLETLSLSLSACVCFNNHLPSAEGSSPISVSCPWSSRLCPWGSWSGRHTCSWPAALDRKQPD